MNKDLIYRTDAIDAIMGQYPEPHYPAWFASVIRNVDSAEIPTTNPWRTADDSPETDMACIVYDEGYYYVAYYKNEPYQQGFYVDGEQSTTVSFWMPLFEISEDQKKIADEQKKKRDEFWNQFRAT